MSSAYSSHSVVFLLLAQYGDTVDPKMRRAPPLQLTLPPLFAYP